MRLCKRRQENAVSGIQTARLDSNLRREIAAICSTGFRRVQF
jgi:hypothetical protein